MQSKWIPICIPWCSQWNMHLWRLVAKTMAFMEFASLPMGWMLRRNFDLTPHCIYLHICIYVEYMQYCNMHPFEHLHAPIPIGWHNRWNMVIGGNLPPNFDSASPNVLFWRRAHHLHFSKTCFLAFSKTLKSTNLLLENLGKASVCCEKHKNAMYGRVKQTQSVIVVDAVDNFAGTLAAIMWD